MSKQNRFPLLSNTCNYKPVTSSSAKMIVKSACDLISQIDSREKPVRTILDLGAGRGELANRLVSPRRSVLAVDISPKVLGQGSHRGFPVAMDARSLALPDHSIDVVICLRTIWTFEKLDKCLAEISRILCRNGSFIAQLWTTPRECRLFSLGSSVLGLYNPDMLLPEGSIGPFQLSPKSLSEMTLSMQLRLCSVERHEIFIDVSGVTDYWDEFRGLAESADYRRLSLPPTIQKKVDETLEHFLNQAYSGAEEYFRIPLTWVLAEFRKY
ncbi:MAG: class I SAM-dependent methyltransferase [Candidatus Sedimenticola sp. (ex Thyasira tokunagai)]